MIDLRSDVVTVPSPEMLKAMMSAKVGNAAEGDDPTVRELEQRLASMFGMDWAIYLPSSTMCNQIAVALLSERGQDVVCEQDAYIHRHEAGGMALHSSVGVRTVVGDYGRLSVAQIEEALALGSDRGAAVGVVALENSTNHGGGSCYKLQQLREIDAFCKKRGLAVHLDGARLFNAMVATGQQPSDYVGLFDTISLCFSKGLGAAMGSVLMGREPRLARVLQLRRAFGGNMRQVGYMAAGCLYALDHHLDGLAYDHRRAAELAQLLTEVGFDVYPVQTNIVIFEPRGELSAAEIVKFLAAQGVLAAVFGENQVRLVTHRDFDDRALGVAVEAIRKLKSS